jgi:hypothetical protein
VGRKGASLGGMGPAVVREREGKAVREGRCEGRDAELEALGMRLGPFPEEPLPGGGFHGTIDREPRHHVRHHADGLQAIGREAPPADSASAEAAFVWADPPERTGVRGGHRPLEMVSTGGREGGDGLRLFGCGSGAALYAWLGSADAPSPPGFYLCPPRRVPAAPSGAAPPTTRSPLDDAGPLQAWRGSRAPARRMCRPGPPWPIRRVALPRHTWPPSGRSSGDGPPAAGPLPGGCGLAPSPGGRASAGGALWAHQGQVGEAA